MATSVLMRLFCKSLFGQMKWSGGFRREESQELTRFDCLLRGRGRNPTVRATDEKMKGDIDHGSKLYWPKASA